GDKSLARLAEPGHLEGMSPRIFSAVPPVGLLCAVLLSSGVGCGPSVNQAAKAEVDRRVAALSQTGARFEAPQALEPRPLAVGQWVEYKTVDEDGKPAFMKQKIVGQQGSAFWFEMEIQ